MIIADWVIVLAQVAKKTSRSFVVGLAPTEALQMPKLERDPTSAS